LQAYASAPPPSAGDLFDPYLQQVSLQNNTPNASTGLWDIFMFEAKKRYLQGFH
jgi:hypothetical protein